MLYMRVCILLTRVKILQDRIISPAKIKNHFKVEIITMQ